MYSFMLFLSDIFIRYFLSKKYLNYFAVGKAVFCPYAANFALRKVRAPCSVDLSYKGNAGNAQELGQCTGGVVMVVDYAV